MTRSTYQLFLALAFLFSIGCSKKENESKFVYTKKDGSETTDITSIEDGKVGFKMVGSDSIPLEAQKLHERARAKGQSGDYDASLDLLKEAISKAPKWAYPHYDMAFTYLLMNDSENALKKYKEVDRLEPKGFFTTKTAIWSLEREAKGEFPPGLYLAYVMLEWEEENSKKEMLKQFTEKIPGFAPAWEKKATLTEDFSEKIGYLEKGLSLNPDAETYGMLILNKAIALNRLNRRNEAVELLKALIESDDSTKSSIGMAKEVLKTIN